MDGYSCGGKTLPVECGFIQHVGEGGEEWLGKKDTGYLYKALRRCWRMRALRDGARTQGDRKGSPLLETAWQADPPVYSRGWAFPCPAALHSFFHSPAESFMVAPVPLKHGDPNPL